MFVDELNRAQLVELKERMLCDQLAEKGEGASYGELAKADELISDDAVMEAYRHTNFTEDDFDCGGGDGEAAVAA